MYELILSPRAIKQIKKFEKYIQQRIISTLERIRIRPESYLIKLIGDPGYKLRIGDFRLYIDLNRNINRIEVTRIGHRKNIYKQKPL